MAIEAAIVAKDEFIEIAVHVLATQAMIRAETPSLHERKDSMNPRQRHMARHPADDARVMTVAAQCQIGRMAVGEERRARFPIGFDESLNGRSGIVLDRGEADAAGARVEIFRVFAARLGLVGIAINHLNCADDEDLADDARLEKGVPFPKGNFRLITISTTPSRGSRIGSIIDRRSF